VTIPSTELSTDQCLSPLLPGGTSEIVAQKFNISRQQQDEYAVESYKRAELAQRSGWFDDEIVPMTVTKGGRETTVTKDEIRYGTTYEILSNIPPAFPDYGKTTHAGNSSQIMDGEFKNNSINSIF
jgi:acetyl-CoA acyltransferase 1